MRSAANLSIRHVQVKVEIMVQGGGDALPAGTKMQDVAMVTGATAGCVVTGAGGAGGGGGAHNTGDDALAGELLRRAAAGHGLLREGARNTVVVAVEQRLRFAQPERQRPGKRKQGF